MSPDIIRPNLEIDQDDEPLRPLPRRKPTRRWCKGKVGREHQVELIFDRRRFGGFWGTECRPFTVQYPNGDDGWNCLHIEVCTECGKITNHYPQCPDLAEGYRQA